MTDIEDLEEIEDDWMNFFHSRRATGDAFREEDHPRHPKGHSEGGQFTFKYMSTMAEQLTPAAIRSDLERAEAEEKNRRKDEQREYEEKLEEEQRRKDKEEEKRRQKEEEEERRERMGIEEDFDQPDDFGPSGSDETKKKLKEAFVYDDGDENRISALWDEHMSAVEPKDFTRRILGDKLAFLQAHITAKGDVLTVSGALKGGGRIERSFDFGDLDVHHDYFKLPADAQGKGAAKDALASQIKLYEELGMRSVSTNANIDVGSYAWAKYGFVAESPTQVKSTVMSRARRLYENKAMSEDDYTTIRNMVAEPTETTVWNVADSPLGKKVLVGDATYGYPSWDAKLDLGNKEQMERLHRYVGK